MHHFGDDSCLLFPLRVTDIITLLHFNSVVFVFVVVAILVNIILGRRRPLLREGDLGQGAHREELTYGLLALLLFPQVSLASLGANDLDRTYQLCQKL